MAVNLYQILILLPPEFTLAAIAAPPAPFAAMIGTGVFGAMHANRGRWLAADAAREGGRTLGRYHC
jgi:hypothetical protein